MFRSLNLNLDIKLFLISIIIFTIKWFFSINEYGLENIFIKVLFNPSGDYTYYSFVHQLSNLNLSEGYSSISEKNRVIGFPFLVIIFHAIFFKIFGLYGFLLLEFLCIFIFLKIFFLIFNELKINDNLSILLSFTFFSLLPISSYLYNLNLDYSLNLKNLYSGFYSLRFPIPLLTNLFFFGFLYSTLKFYTVEKYNSKNKYLFLSFILLGFLLSSFFYFFLTSALLLFVLLINQYKKNIFSFGNIINISKYALIFLLISSLFIYQILSIEKDYYERVGTIFLSLENKKFLLNHLLNGFLKKEFLIILLINVILGVINFIFNKDTRKFFIFFNFVFCSSILIPFIYLIIMNQVTFFSNFIFVITMCCLILLKINLIGVLLIFNKFNFLKKFNNSFLFIAFFLLFLINSVYFKNTSKVEILSEGIHFNSNDDSSLRDDFTELINNLESIHSNKKLLLTNDIHTQLWWIFKGKKKFYFPYVFNVSLSDKVIEEQLFNAFKFLDLNFKTL